MRYHRWPGGWGGDYWDGWRRGGRYQCTQAEIAFSYRRKAREDPQHSLIVNGAAGYFLAQDQSRVWADLREFVSVMGRTFVRPVPSALYEECVMELREPQVCVIVYVRVSVFSSVTLCVCSV